MKPLYIAILSIHSSPLGTLGTHDTGGMSVVIRETARELGELGHRVDIFTAAAGGTKQKVSPAGKNVRLIQLNGNLESPIAKSEMIRHLPKFHDALVAFTKTQEIHYDLLHSHYWISGRLGLRAQYQWGIPHAITFHTLGWLKTHRESDPEGPCSRIAWECRLARTSQRVLVATEQERTALVEKCQIEDSRIGITPFGVNPTTFDIRPSTGIRSSIGLEPDESLVLFVGRFVRIKGIERLMEAVAILNATRKVRLLLIGGDGSRSARTQRLQQLARQLRIEERVAFKDPVVHEALAEYYNAADVLALPAFYESYGLVVLESMACGTPVVATPVGIAPLVIQEGKTGRVVREPGAEGLAKCLWNVLQSVKQGTIRPRKVRASVVNYHWKGVASALLNEYLRLTRERSAPGARRGSEMIRSCCGLCGLDLA